MLDLWTFDKDRQDLHQNFVRIASDPESRSERELISDWSRGFLDRDGKAVTEFQTTFNSTFWELYLHASWRQIGFTIDMSHPRPDFVLSTSSRTIVAEATIASHSAAYRPEWEKDSAIDTTSIDYYEILRYASLRLSNSIAAKHKKYVNEYSTLNHVVNRPFLLCLGAYDQPYFFLQGDNAIRRVLLGLDMPLYSIDPDSGEREIWGNSHVTMETKDSGSGVKFGLFLTPEYADISAVLFSCTATMCKVRALAPGASPAYIFSALRYNDKGPKAHHIVATKAEYTESLLDGLSLFMNPHAKSPLDSAPFAKAGVAINTFDLKSREYSTSAPDGSLFQRTCMRPVSNGFMKSFVQSPSDAHLQSPHSAKPWPQESLRAVEGEVTMFADNHMAHMRGWTILVSRFLGDGTWAWQCRRGELKGLAAWFEKARSSPNSDLHVSPKWYPSRDTAFAAATAFVRRL